MRPGIRLLGIFFLVVALCLSCHSQPVSFLGQASTWLSGNQQTEKFAQFGLRYIPAISINAPLSQMSTFDIEASVKAFHISYYQSSGPPVYEKDLSAYRAWARFSASQYELRLGLQKINFGSASIFRALMWFDMIDPRDPLQITMGVYGLLGRYYFLNNTNIWLWGLLGNDETKGWELFPTAKGKPEFGGRIQFPLFNGETGLSYHHRKMNIGALTSMLPLPADSTVIENRYAIDGKWDIGIGFWIEAVLAHHKHELLPYEWERTYTIGIDYTFDVGNGFNVLTEYFALENTKDVFKSGEGIAFSALSMNYPLNLLDTALGILYYDWKEKELYRFISFQRNYDNWSFFLFAFWNPDEYKLDINSRESNQFAGKGLQLMVVFNH
jgi:hypothetical protein